MTGETRVLVWAARYWSASVYIVPYTNIENIDCLHLHLLMVPVAYICMVPVAVLSTKCSTEILGHFEHC